MESKSKWRVKKDKGESTCLSRLDGHKRTAIKAGASQIEDDRK